MTLRSLLRQAPEWGWWAGSVVGAVVVVIGANAWAIPSGAGLSPYGPSPQAVSSADAVSIPIAGVR